MHVLIDGKEKDVKVDEVNAGNYIVPENEKHLFHVKQEIKSFDQKTGKKISVPVVQKYGVKTYPTVKRQLTLQGWEIEELYNPTAFLNEQKQKIVKAKEAQKLAQEKALQEKIDLSVKEALEKQAQMYEAKFAKTKKSSKKDAE